MQRLPSWWALVPLVVVLGLLGGVFYAGWKYRSTTVLADQATQAQTDLRELRREVTRSVTAAQEAIQAQQALQTSYSTLQGKFDEFRLRGPIVVFRDRHAGVVPDPPVSGGSAAVESAQEALVPSGHGTGDAGAAVGLSLGAVWMWNSALTGTDTPAGACGAADPASPACALDSGIGLEDAWDNHTANARTCAQDRLRHQKLIDYLKGSPHE